MIAEPVELTKEAQIEYLLSDKFLEDRPDGQYKHSELILILDQYGLTGDYSGGGDSGGVDSLEFADNDEDVNMPDHLHNQLEEMILNEMDYGGFAFEGSCSGTLSYNADDKHIEISGSESNDDYTDLCVENIDFSKLISPTLASYIDSINVRFVYGDNDSDEDERTNIRINVRHGVDLSVFATLSERIEARLNELASDAATLYRFETIHIQVDEVVSPQAALAVTIQAKSEDIGTGWSIDLTAEDNEDED